MVVSDCIMFAVSVTDTIALTWLQLYFITALSDFECGYCNAEACCARINKYINVKTAGHVFQTTLMLLHGYWFLFFLNFPMMFWMMHKIFSVDMGHKVYDPELIQHHLVLARYMKEGMVFLGFYVVTCVIYLFYFVVLVLEANP